jgi:pectin methylesterase-like acyl-CoA thioesterase
VWKVQPTTDTASSDKLARVKRVCPSVALYLFVALGAVRAGLAFDLFPANGSTQVCIDTPLSITFDQPPHVGTSGAIRIFQSDGTLVDVVDLPDPNSRKRTVGGAVSDNGTPHLFNYFPVIVTGNTAAIYPHRQLDYGQPYYVTIDPGVLVDDQGFAGLTSPQTWRFSTKLSAPLQGTTQVTVATDGTGDFCTVQGAIDFVPVDNAQTVNINVRKGIYTELVYVVPTKPFITVRGEDRDRTVIQYTNNNTLNSPNPSTDTANRCIQQRIPNGPDFFNCWRAMFGVEASDFTLENITLHNTTPLGGSQAEAFRGNNDRILLNRVNLSSFQDTLRLQTSSFVTNSYIEGDVDFMWGTGAAFFQKSEFAALHAAEWYTQVRNPQTNHGFVYVGNRFTRSAGVADNSYYLSRIEPLRFPFSEVVFINNAMDMHIIPVGWELDPKPATTCAQAPSINFWEYHSTDLDGIAMDTSQRLSCSRQITDAEAAQYSDPAFVLAGWVPYTLNATPATVAPGRTPGPVTPGTNVTVNWSAPNGHSERDFIGLYRAGDTQLLLPKFTTLGTTGTVEFTMPSTPGAYELRYFVPPNKTRVTSSNVITVIPQ